MKEATTPARSAGKPLRLLMLCPDFKPNLGGEAELAFCVAVALQARGCPLMLLTKEYEEKVIEDAALDGVVRRELITFASLRCPSAWLHWPGDMWSTVHSVRRAIDQHQANMCLLTSYATWVVLALWRCRARYALFLHGEDVAWMLRRDRVSRWLLLRACARASWLFFNSEFSRSQLLAVAPQLAAKSEAVGCGVRASEDEPAWESRNQARSELGWADQPVLLTVAKLEEKKGIATVLRALPAILQRSPNCRYVIVGEGDYRSQLTEIAQEEGITDSVTFTGRVDEVTKQKIYAASDIYVMVSQRDESGREEGFGIAFLEANLHGLPVIGSRCGGIIEVIDDDVNGILVDQRRPDQVAAAVSRLLDDPMLRQTMADHGRQRIANRFNWPTIAEQIDQRLDSVLGV